MSYLERERSLTDPGRCSKLISECLIFIVYLYSAKFEQETGEKNRLDSRCLVLLSTSAARER